jgi:starch-binding outer membrane protein, SusD/RagB family
MKFKQISAGLLAAAALAACDSPLDTNPTASIPSAEAMDTPEEIRVAVNGMYDAYSAGDFDRNLLIFPDLYADNFQFLDTYTSDEEVFNQNIRTTNTGVSPLWQVPYIAINRANNVLAALDEGVDGLDEDEAEQYRGEALFVRGHMHFNLVQLFGGVPVITEPTSAVSEENNVPRSSAAEVYAAVEADLRQAQGLLGAGGPERATSGAATALLARVNLYAGDWAQARDFATQVIESGRYELVDDFASIWEEQNTDEAIFELQYTVNDPGSFSTWFMPDAEGGRGSFPATADLRLSYGATADERNADGRYAGTFLPSPYGAYFAKYFRTDNGDDNWVVLRLAEMYLIRSEAVARLAGDLDAARADINEVRARADLAPLPATVNTREQILQANLDERRREFAAEGHRFFDLRRFRDVLPSAAALVNQLYGAEFRLLFPIPQREIDANPELSQNPGY